MGVVLASRRSREAAVVIRDELWGEGVCASLSRIPRSQLLHQSVLQRQVSALDATLRCRGVGTENADVQAAQGSTELCDASPALGLLLVDPEHPGLVAVPPAVLLSKREDLTFDLFGRSFRMAMGARERFSGRRMESRQPSATAVV